MVPLVTAIIVTHNSAGEIAECVSGLLGDERVEIIVVDSGSADGSVDIASRVPGIRCIPEDVNVGWSRASNHGAKQAHGRALAFVNPDARPSAAQLIEMATRLAPPIAAIAPRFVQHDGAPQHFYFRLAGPLTGPFLYLNSGQRLDAKLGGPINRRHLYGLHLPVADPDHAGAACVVVDADTFFRLGCFDERMFVFFSDMDLSRRLKAAGLGLEIAWDVTVGHQGGGSVSALSLDRLQVIVQRDYLAYSRAAYGPLGRAVTVVAILFFSGVVPSLMAAGRLDRAGFKRCIRRVKAVLRP